MLTSRLVRSTRPAGPLIGNVLMLGAGLLAILMLSKPSLAEPMVVYGNLNADGSGGLTSTSTTISPSEVIKKVAAGFTTGTSIQDLYILTVTLGLAAPEGNPGLRTVGIYADSSGNPGALLYTSSSVNVTTNRKYSFSFPWAELEASTKYWVIPQDPILWYTADTFPFNVPDGQNGSGYEYGGTKINNGSVWGNSGTTDYAISVVAVPEPGTIPLAGLGIATVAWACRRRRRRAAAGV